MKMIAAWVISIAVVVLACRLPRRVLTALMILGLALLAVWTLALFAL
jgi:hypothetical protein